MANQKEGHMNDGYTPAERLALFEQTFKKRPDLDPLDSSFQNLTLQSSFFDSQRGYAEFRNTENVKNRFVVSYLKLPKGSLRKEVVLSQLPSKRLRYTSMGIELDPQSNNIGIRYVAEYLNDFSNSPSLSQVQVHTLPRREEIKVAIATFKPLSEQPIEISLLIDNSRIFLDKYRSSGSFRLMSLSPICNFGHLTRGKALPMLLYKMTSGNSENVEVSDLMQSEPQRLRSLQTPSYHVRGTPFTFILERLNDRISITRIVGESMDNSQQQVIIPNLSVKEVGDLIRGNWADCVRMVQNSPVKISGIKF